VLRVIKAAQRLGFSLDEVADLLQTGRHRHVQVDPGLQAHAAAKISEIDARIDDLRIIRATLNAAIEAGCNDLMACATNDCCPVPFDDIARLPVFISDTGGVAEDGVERLATRSQMLDTVAIVDGTVPVTLENS